MAKQAFQFQMNPMQSYKEILDTYWPVIEKAIEVQGHYNSKKDGVTRVCPDITGAMIAELIKARKACPIKREVE